MPDGSTVTTCDNGLASFLRDFSLKFRAVHIAILAQQNSGELCDAHTEMRFAWNQKLIVADAGKSDSITAEYY